MNELIWLSFGLIIGWLGTTSYLVHRLRPVKVEVTVDWNTIGQGMGELQGDLIGKMTVNVARTLADSRPPVLVDWSVIHCAVEGAGSRIIGKAEGETLAHRH